MTESALSNRTARVLGAHLDRLATTLERGAVAPSAAARLLDSATAATTHAVTLELLTASSAGELWREAAERHPGAARLRPAAARFAPGL